jgi:cyclomaltodextrinase
MGGLARAVRTRSIIPAVGIALAVWGWTRTGAAAAAPNTVQPVRLLPTLSVVTGTTTVLRLDDIFISDPGAVRSGSLPPSPIAISDGPGPREITLAIPDSVEGVVPVTIVLERARFVVLLRCQRKPRHEFVCKPDGPATKVFLVGSFNGWNAGAEPMEGPDADGAFRRIRELEPGRHQYKFVIDGNWVSDAANPNREPDGFQGFNSILETGGGSAVAGPPPRIVRVTAKPSIPNASPAREHLFELAFDTAGSTPTLDPGSVIATMDNARLAVEDVSTRGNRIFLRIPKQPAGRHSVRVNARDTAGRWADECGFTFDSGPAEKLPPNWRDEILYFAFTDRFFNGDPSNDKPVTGVEELAPRANHMGGDWAGLRQKIEEGYFKRLGVTALWISPVQKNAEGAWGDALPPHRKFTSYHGYWPIAAREPNQRFGTMEELKALVQTAHKNGLKVLADFVSNHVHQDHHYFKDHPDWFGTMLLDDGTSNIRMFDEHPLTTWFDDFMPDFDYDKNPDALAAVVADAIWWIREAGFDGFRHDATKHVSHAFWCALTQAIRREIEVPKGTHFYQVGESIVGREKLMEYVNPGELDGQFDFPLFWDMRNTFAEQSIGFDQLDKTLTGLLRYYGPFALNSAFVGNHDFARFMAFAEGDLTSGDSNIERDLGWQRDLRVTKPSSYAKIRNAFTFVLTLPQVPMIYYGDEIGMTGAGDPDNRRPMRFGKEVTAAEQEVFDHVAKLTATRRAHRALRDGDLTTLRAEKDIYVYLRSTFDERLIVAFNRATTPANTMVRMPDWCPPVKSAKPLVGSASATVSGDTMELTLPPASSTILLVSTAK